VSDYNDLFDLNSLGDLMKSFMQYLSLLLCFELVMGPVQGSLFLPSQAYALDCPVGQSFNESVNRCLTKESVIKASQKSEDCVGQDKDCYKNNANDAMKGKMPDSKGNAYKVKAAGVVAIAIPLVIVTSVLLQKKKAGKNFSCKPTSLLLMYGAAAALGVGEIYGYFNHKAKLKEIQEEWGKTVVPKNEDGTDKKNSQGTEAQSQAFEFLAQNEDQVGKTAKTKKGFYLAATGLFAAGAIAAAVEQHQLLAARKVLAATPVPAGPALVAQEAAKLKAQQQIAKLTCNTDKSLDNTTEKDGKKSGATNELEEKEDAKVKEAATEARNAEDKLQTESRNASQEKYKKDREGIEDENLKLEEKKTAVNTDGSLKNPSAESQAILDKRIAENKEKIIKLDESQTKSLENEKINNDKIVEQNKQTIEKNKEALQKSKNPREQKEIQAQNEELSKKNAQLAEQNKDIKIKSDEVATNHKNDELIAQKTSTTSDKSGNGVVKTSDKSQNNTQVTANKNSTQSYAKEADDYIAKKKAYDANPSEANKKAMEQSQKTLAEVKITDNVDTKGNNTQDPNKVQTQNKTNTNIVEAYEKKDADFKTKADAYKKNPSEANKKAMEASQEDFAKYKKENNILDEVVVKSKKTTVEGTTSKDGAKTKENTTIKDKTDKSKTPENGKKTNEKVIEKAKVKQVSEFDGMNDSQLNTELNTARKDYKFRHEMMEKSAKIYDSGRLQLKEVQGRLDADLFGGAEIDKQTVIKIKKNMEANRLMYNQQLQKRKESGGKIDQIKGKLNTKKINFIKPVQKNSANTFASVFSLNKLEINTFQGNNSLAIQNIAGAKNSEDLINLMNQLGEINTGNASKISYLDDEMANILRPFKIESSTALLIAESYLDNEVQDQIEENLNSVVLQNYRHVGSSEMTKTESPRTSIGNTIANSIISPSYAQGGGGILDTFGKIMPLMGGLKQVMGVIKFNGGAPLSSKDLNAVHEKTKSWVIKAIGKPVTRLAINGVLGGWMGIMAIHMNKQQKLAAERAEKLRAMKEEFVSANGIMNCKEEDRLDATKPKCFCFTPDNKVNPERSKQPACANTLAKMNYDPFGGAATSDKVCLDQNQNVDTACSCRAKKSCIKISSGLSMAGFKPGSFKMISAGSSPAQDLLNGNIGGGDIADSAGINAARIQQAANDMLGKIDPKAMKEKNGFGSALEKGLMASGAGLSMGSGGGSTPMPNSPASAAAALDKEIQENKEDEITKSGNAAAAGGDFNPTEEPEFGMTEDQAADQEIEIAEVMGQELDTGNNDINSGSTTNIFDVLSNRYQRSGMRRLFNDGKGPVDAPDKKELTE
jgi:hypothetical protein